MTNRSDSDSEYISDWSENEASSPVAVIGRTDTRSRGHVPKDNIVKIKRNPERIMIVGNDTKGLCKRNSSRTEKPRVVTEEFLSSETFKYQS